MRYELLGGAHARLARILAGDWGRLAGDRGRLAGDRGRLAGDRGRLIGERGQGTVEYVGLVLLVAVLIAGVVKASGGFSDTGIADAVVKKLKGAISGVGEG